jgi:hypothetical protein
VPGADTGSYNKLARAGEQGGRDAEPDTDGGTGAGLNQYTGTNTPSARCPCNRCAQMPRYYFAIRNSDYIEDEDGFILPDDQTARAHAMQIIHELQKGDEPSWGRYTMEVRREGKVLWRIPFEVSDPPS